MPTSLRKTPPLTLLLILALATCALTTSPAGGSPAIDLQKSFMWTSGDGSQVGDEGVYTYVITNTGDARLWVDLYDSQFQWISVPDFLLDPGEMTIATADLVLTQYLLDMGVLTNQATAYGETDEGALVTNTDFVTVNFLTYPQVDLVKYVSVDGGATFHDANAPPGPTAYVGEPVIWKFTVANPGNVTVAGMTVYDYWLGIIPLPVSNLAPGEMTEAFAYGVAMSGQQSNHAAIYAGAGMGPVEDYDGAYYFGVLGGFTIVKSVGLSPAGPWLDANELPGVQLPAGTEVYFQYVITNDGSTTLNNVTLTDSVFDAGSTPPFNPPVVPNPFEPGNDYTYVYGPVTLPAGPHSNVATATGSTPTGWPISVTDPVYIEIGGAYIVYQAYPGRERIPGASAGYLSHVVEGAPTAVPGVLCIVPQGAGQPPWANFVRAYVDEVPYTIKNVSLCKRRPDIVQCNDVFNAPEIPNPVCQHGTPNIRLWWPLMYEVPGTTWTLSIFYGTPTPYDADGPTGPSPLGYAHTQEWQWRVEATIPSMRDLLALFHQVPFGLDEVPLISDEVLYQALLAKLDALRDAVDEDDLTGASMILGEFEMEVMDACIMESPVRPRPTGTGTGIAQTRENPACCKLLVDAEYVGFKLGILQPAKGR